MHSKCSRKWISFTQEPVATFCKCKSACTTKRKENGSRGCPCKGRNVLCTDECNCGTNNKPCRNRVCMHIKLNTFTSCYWKPWSLRNNLCIPFLQDSNGQSSSVNESRRVRPRLEGSGFRLSSDATDASTEEQQQIKENNNVKVLSYLLVRHFFFSYLFSNYDVQYSSRINICLVNATSVCDIWHYFFSLSVPRLKWVRSNIIDYNYVNDFPIFF